MPIESSTVTACGPPSWSSRSVRPRHGRISDSSPHSACERFSLVLTLTVRSQAAHRGSGRDRCRAWRRRSCRPSRRTPARGRRASRGWCRPSRGRARRGARTRTRRRARSRKGSGIFSQIPIVRSPCTFECPRTGHSPAPALADVAAQQHQVGDLLDRRDGVAVLGEAHRPADDHPVRAAVALRQRLDLAPASARSRSSTSSQSRSRRCATYSSNSEQCSATNSSSTAPASIVSLAERGEERLVAGRAGPAGTRRPARCP